MAKLIAADLFCGAGGLSEGLAQAGFQINFASDIHQTYTQTYKYNHPNTYVCTEDIRNLSNKQVLEFCQVKPGDLDLLAGGPPCQGFSINAPVRTMEDERNHLFVHFLRVAETLKPKYILIENVPGIVSLEKGTVVKAIYKSLNKLGYKVRHMILFAAHYGVPQMRWRTFFIGTRLKNAECLFPYPTHFAQGVANFTGGKNLCFKIESKESLFGPQLLDYTTVWDAISDLPVIENGGGADEMQYDTPPKSEYQKLLRENSKILYNHRAPTLGKINLERLKYIPQGGSWRDIPFDLLPAGLKKARRSDHTKRYGRLDPNGICSTILTKCDPHWGSFFHPTQERTLTVREAARIQSFPDRFRFLGSLTEQYEQVGNAVPPLLGKAIGEIIAQQIFANQLSGKLQAV
ncbi:DNA cytosine methyltransferase [Zhaonella formicivorans]|jgi:DNA (cytosine-5)-methyltransferase 1|uniref:DNA cytosine methyltransferase n=1 Tax=Zhaonella formicivorans TaxID=2528593 RepID=UPI0010D3F44E|nr:DNA cytosine methyltransferase [Zhaonella formicivorans]